MRRCLLLLAALLVLAPAAGADVMAPVADLRVHEWGVWKVRQGEVTHLADLRRESPSFVRQTQPTVGWGNGGMISRKPVVYVYASQPMDLDVEVAFRGGGPWLFYPATLPVPCRESARRDLPFGRAAPMGCEPDRLHWRVRAGVPAALPAVSPAHFWSRLREVPSSTLVAHDGTAEKFLFYDGPVTFPAAFRVGRGSLGQPTFQRVGPSGQTPLIVAWGSRWVPVPAMGIGAGLGIDTVNPWPVPPRSVAAELTARLLAEGLSPAEARSLVETWRPEIDAPGLRAFWLLTRPEYDSLLPIRITPAPRELVRVGLVIEDLGT